MLDMFNEKQMYDEGITENEKMRTLKFSVERRVKNDKKSAHTRQNSLCSPSATRYDARDGGRLRILSSKY